MSEARETDIQKQQDRHTGPPQQTPWLERRLDLTQVDPQIWIFLAILVVAALLRFWDLGGRAMHHDEAVHAWYSWRFYTGEELYRYDPAFHGPFLYHLTALLYFLFGASDAIARVPEALFGVLMVALCYPLRRWLGRRGWLIAAGLLALSPTFVYFSRFARHDALVAPLTLATAITLFRYLEERRPRDLTLMAAALALAYASHELTLMTIFIFASFLGLTFLLDRQGPRFQTEGRIIAGIVLLIALLGAFSLTTAGIESPALHTLILVLGLLALGYLGLSLLWTRRFSGEPSPVVQAVHGLAKNPRPLLTALGVLGIIFGLSFTNFLTHPKGFLDGLLEGLRYWIGQQQVSRGGQPWFYYLLLLPLYEPIILTAGATGLGIVVAQVLRRRPRGKDPSKTASSADRPPMPPFAIFLVYWAVFSLVLYSWAGEKMPWLLLQIALPGVLLAAMALDRFLSWISWRTLWHSGDWVVGPIFLLLAFALSGLAALSREQVPHEAARPYIQLQMGVLAVIGLGLTALLIWRIYRSEGRHIGQSFAALGLLILGAYTIRSTFLLSFYHGDIPREMLVYTQTAPSVPLVVRQIERLSIDQTRKTRPLTDPTGGHGLTISIDSSREAGLEWPFDWYLRDFSRAGTLTHFDGTQGAPPESDVLLVLADNEPTLRPYLQGKYTGIRLKHRWWFPEFETYRRWTLLRQDITEQGYPTMPWLILSTYSTDGVSNLWNYLLYRRLPYPLGSQDFFFYVRSDLLPAGTVEIEPDPYIENLIQRTAIKVLGSAGSAPGQLNLPRGIALGEDQTLYVADSGNHRVVRFDGQGQAISWGSVCYLETNQGCLDPDGAGPLPLGAGQFNEPWGIAVDGQGRVYVADTWNHRIQVFDGDGSFLGQWGEGRLVDADADQQGRWRDEITEGFFGPRGVAVDDEGRIYVTDTGNERIMVYAIHEDEAGQIRAEYLYQWGTMGLEPGQLLEPVGIAVGAAGRVYVADTWNLRIQVFAPDSSGQMNPEPVVTWKVTGWESESRENKPFLAVSPGGQVYFTVPDRHYAVATDGRGKILEVWGGYGDTMASFNLPTGIAVDAQGQVYVSDAWNGRVLVFTVP